MASTRFAAESAWASGTKVSRPGQVRAVIAEETERSSFARDENMWQVQSAILNRSGMTISPKLQRGVRTDLHAATLKSG